MPADVAVGFADEPVVVTGAGGWFGTALVAALGGAQDGIRPASGLLRTLVHHPQEVEHVASAAPRAEVHVGDVTDPRAIDRLLADTAGGTVVHAAGIIHPRQVGDWEAVNVGGTRTVLDAAERHGLKRVVYVSSNSAFGCNPGPDDVFRAEEPFNPYMGYGRSKMLAELAVTAANGPIETVIVRPPWFYGPYQPARQTTFFTMVRKGRFPLPGDGRNVRSMVHVENLVLGTVLAATNESAAGRSYWIADARPYTMREILDTVRDALAAEGLEVSAKPNIRVPNVVGDLAETADRLLQARGIYSQELHVLSEMNKTIACEIDRAEQELAYRPPVELFGGMRQSIRWCLEQGYDL